MNKILIVDNDPFYTTLISNILEKQHYSVIQAHSGEESIAKATEEKPNIVIMNLKLPEMGGIKAANIIKEKLHKQFTFTIMVLDQLGNKIKIQPLLSHFDDYLEKPFKKEVFIDKIKRAFKITNAFQKVNLLNEKNKNLLKEKEILIQTLETEQQTLEQKVKKRTEELNHKNNILIRKTEEIERDMQITSRLQINLLPKEAPKLKQYKIYNTYLPMNQIGGDFYDFIAMRENKIGIIIGDVSGHGISSAFITSMIKTALSSNRKILSKPSLLLDYINKQLIDKIYYYFVTAAYGVFDLENYSFIFSSAGHMPVLLYKTKEQEIMELKASGTILGITNDVSFPEKKYEIDKGDKILFFTDGLVEVFNKKKEIYGIKKLKNLFHNSYELKGKNLIKHIINDTKNFAHNKKFNDDVAIILIEVQ